MKYHSLLLLCAVMLTACSNLGEKRTLLSAAGFRTIPATTPGQLAKLNSMKPGKITQLHGKKGTVYVFADTPRKALRLRPTWITAIGMHGVRSHTATGDGAWPPIPSPEIQDPRFS
jgi:hypothetical protein